MFRGWVLRGEMFRGWVLRGPPWTWALPGIVAKWVVCILLECLLVWCRLIPPGSEKVSHFSERYPSSSLSLDKKSMWRIFHVILCHKQINNSLKNSFNLILIFMVYSHCTFVNPICSSSVLCCYVHTMDSYGLDLFFAQIRFVIVFVFCEYIIRVRLYCCESENDIASKWVRRESNLMFKLSSDKDQRKMNL